MGLLSTYDIIQDSKINFCFPFVKNLTSNISANANTGDIWVSHNLFVLGDISANGIQGTLGSFVVTDFTINGDASFNGSVAFADPIVGGISVEGEGLPIATFSRPSESTSLFYSAIGNINQSRISSTGSIVFFNNDPTGDGTDGVQIMQLSSNGVNSGDKGTVNIYGELVVDDINKDGLVLNVGTGCFFNGANGGTGDIAKFTRTDENTSVIISAVSNVDSRISSTKKLKLVVAATDGITGTTAIEMSGNTITFNGDVLFTNGLDLGDVTFNNALVDNDLTVSGSFSAPGVPHFFSQTYNSASSYLVVHSVNNMVPIVQIYSANKQYGADSIDVVDANSVTVSFNASYDVTISVVG